MTIAGFQPLSLGDYPGVICSIVFTQGCLFRCVYCHNPELIPMESPNPQTLLSEETILERLEQRKKMVEGVCITGGEPTIHIDLPTFIKKIKQRGLLVKLDTNGVNPRMVEQLLKDRLVDFFAMDLKHGWDRYTDVIGAVQKNVIENCKKTFDLIQTSSVPHEFRTTVYPGLHKSEDLEGIADQLHEGERYALQQIRYEKTLNPNLPKTELFDLEAVAARIRVAHPLLQVEVRA